MNERIKALAELKDFNTNSMLIKALSDEECHQWYLRIKESLPKLKALFPTEELENAVAEYEREHGIL